jgi:hypothetical protein
MIHLYTVIKLQGNNPLKVDGQKSSKEDLSHTVAAVAIDFLHRRDSLPRPDERESQLVLIDLGVSANLKVTPILNEVRENCGFLQGKPPMFFRTSGRERRQKPLEDRRGVTKKVGGVHTPIARWLMENP